MTHFKNVYMFWGQTGFGLNASESSTQTGPGIIFEDEVSSVMTVFLKTVKPKIALKGFCKKTKKQLCIFLWVAFKIMDMPSSTRKSLIMTICGIIYSSFKS